VSVCVRQCGFIQVVDACIPTFDQIANCRSNWAQTIWVLRKNGHKPTPTEKTKIQKELNFPGLGGHLNRFDENSKQEVPDTQKRWTCPDLVDR
jgi:hypothetical protein